MSRARRGGLTLTTGKIGRVNCLRQDVLMPGERVNLNMAGKVRLESLRERDVMRINAHLATFMTPIRWLWSDWPDYVKQGPDTALSPPLTSSVNKAAIGIGHYFESGAKNTLKWFTDAYLRCVNEWYIWPEESDFVLADIGDNGVPAVPLQSAWNRCRYDTTPDQTADYQVSAASSVVDVRALAETQAKFRSAMKRDVMSFNRWMELVKETWKGDPSREVDQVPIMLDQVEVGVNPREIPATDGASLGQWQSLYDFQVDHDIRGIVAPEHCIITTLLTVRFPSTIEQINPMASEYLDWYETVGDPEYLAAARPVEVERRELVGGTSTLSLGYLPGGWQWRADNAVIGKQIDTKESFPYMDLPTTQAHAKDATRVKDAFRSQTLDDYLVDIYFDLDSRQPIGDSMDSYFSGMMDDLQVNTGGRNREFPKGGKVI